MSTRRFIVALAVSLVGAVFVWIATPYVDLIINCNARAADMSDGYLPAGVTCFVLLLVLLVNPVLWRFVPRFAMNRAQLAMVFALMLVGGYMGGDGMMRRLPYNIIGAPIQANQSQRYSSNYEKLDLPPSLFPEKLGFGEPTPHGDHFVDELPPLDPSNPDGPKQPIPWRIWIKPLLSWGSFFLCGWLLMLGLAQLLIPQWRDNERLPFPLLHVQRAIIASPESGRCFPTLFSRKSFWIPALLVFLIKAPAYLDRYWPGLVPVIPLEWNIADCFTEGMARHLSGYVKQGYIFFLVIGIAFFMRTRITFSVWFFAVAYAVYEMLCRSLAPPFQYSTVGDHRDGAMLGLTVAVLWLGWRHFAHVFTLLYRPAKTPQDCQMRKALIMFLVGCVGLFSWMCWVGTGVGWAAFFVAAIFVISLLTTRLVAETGLPFSQAHLGLASFMYLFPVGWITPVAAWFSYIIGTFFSYASVASPAALASHALQLDQEAGPKRRWRLSLLIVGIMVIGMVVCGGAHIYGSFNHSVTMDGLESPVNPYLFNNLNYATGNAEKIMDGQKPTVPYNRPAHLIFGAVLAGGLELASLSSPGWFLHPIGLLVLRSWYINRVWVSIFIGWLLKILILRYGGGRVYRQVTPFFLGLIVGDVISLIFWGLAPAIITLCGVRG